MRNNRSHCENPSPQGYRLDSQKVKIAKPHMEPSTISSLQDLVCVPVIPTKFLCFAKIIERLLYKGSCFQTIIHGHLWFLWLFCLHLCFKKLSCVLWKTQIESDQEMPNIGIPCKSLSGLTSKRSSIPVWTNLSDIYILERMTGRLWSLPGAQEHGFLQHLP